MVFFRVLLNPNESLELPNQYITGYIRNEGNTRSSFIIVEEKGISITKTLNPHQYFSFHNLYVRKVINTGTGTTELSYSDSGDMPQLSPDYLMGVQM